jgi:hypothetical protein
VTNGISGDITVIDSGPDSLTYNTVVDTYSQVIDTNAATPETDGLPVV